MKQNPAEPNPLLRFWTEPGPWNAQRIAGDPRQAPANPQTLGFGDPMRRNSHALQYEYRSPRSDIGSSTTGRNPLDSGYGGSRSLATSAPSVDQFDQGRSCHSLSGDVQDYHLDSEYTYQDTSGRNRPSPHLQYSSADNIAGDAAQPSAVTFELACQYPHCDVISKNQSEHRKHMLRHEKPFKCEVPGCSKVDGFSTNNDLDRHKKSVHKIMPKNSSDRSFRCAARNCPKHEKIWPRLDNFRQHCLRIHQEEDCEDLVRKSAMDPGLSMGANNLDDSSHQGAGGPGHGLGISDLPDFLDPSITINRSLNPTPVQSHSIFDQRETHMKTAGSDIMSPGPLKMTETIATCTSFPQKLSPNNLLQVPKMHDFHSTPPSPSAKASPNLGHQDGSSMLRRNTKSKPMASAKKAEEVSEELATQITKFIDLYRGPSTDMRANIKNQLLLTFNPELSRKRCAQMASLKDGPDSSKKRLIACNQCPKTTARQCDMKKHEKRHTRPYGCTFPGCSKKLGSKNDWKRHENTQHYQIETWRCHERFKTNAMGQCARIFYRREQFQSHLREKHGIEKDDDIRDRCKRYRIGRNGQMAFWCGFCKQIVELKTEGLDAWEERFSHIDDFHYKKGQTIYDWVPLDSDIPKGLIERGSLAGSGPADDDDDHGGNEGSSDDDGDDSSSTSKRPSPRPARTRSSNPTGGSADGGNGSKIQATSSKRGRIWNCVSLPSYALAARQGADEPL
ncbi:MAG: hypothetical protein Q9207_004604 [Kuettlingeria erythrocarpa]